MHTGYRVHVELFYLRQGDPGRSMPSLFFSRRSLSRTLRSAQLRTWMVLHGYQATSGGWRLRASTRRGERRRPLRIGRITFHWSSSCAEPHTNGISLRFDERVSQSSLNTARAAYNYPGSLPVASSNACDPDAGVALIS